MTPIANAVNTGEIAYNIAHRKARNCVERCIGVLKGRFRILGKDRILRYTPQKAGTIINACVVLHNILIKSRFPIGEDDEEEVEHDNFNAADEAYFEAGGDSLLQRGNAYRQSVVAEYFT